MAGLTFQSTQPKRAATVIEYYKTAAVTFQSTQPKRAATDGVLLGLTYIKISIHAAKEGCDKMLAHFFRIFRQISIHAAQEGCDKEQFPECFEGGISIHAAQEGCDEFWQNEVYFLMISIHAAQEGCDLIRLRSQMRRKSISIHAAQEGCDRHYVADRYHDR